MSWFRRPPSATELLVKAIIDGELRRRETDALLEQKRSEFDLRKLELEGAQLEARGEEMRRERADREKLRQERQQHAAHIREIRAAKRAASNSQDDSAGPCRVCKNQSDPTLTAREIEWHSMGHREGSIWAQ